MEGKNLLFMLVMASFFFGFSLILVLAYDSHLIVLTKVGVLQLSLT